MKRTTPLKANPEKTRAWQERSRRKAFAKHLSPGSGQKKVRHSSLRRGRRRRLSAEERHAAALWKLALHGQPCAVCGRKHFWPDVHHVVSQQELRKRGKDHLLWDERNGMPLCPIGGPGNGCHERHENASRRIPVSALSEANHEFGREVLGESWPGYLARYYREETT